MSEGKSRTTDWISVASMLPPEGRWVRTRRDGEVGENVCKVLLWWKDCPEWVELGGGRTTVTHHSFAAPTHWAFPRIE